MLKPMLRALQERAHHLKQETYALYLAARDPRTPRLVRVLALVIVAYAISPIDLIPDVIPVVGYLDDLILIPAALVLLLRLIPPEVLADARRQSAATLDARHPAARVAAAVTVALWGVFIILIVLAVAG